MTGIVISNKLGVGRPQYHPLPVLITQNSGCRAKKPENVIEDLILYLLFFRVNEECIL